MPKNANETSKILKFLDTLFDSVNGSTRKAPFGKPLKGAVHSNSGHIPFWKECISSLKNMHFSRESTEGRLTPPSLGNLIFTVEGFIELAAILESKGLKYFLPRHFNQDPLENFFGQLRMHRGRNINPTCLQFRDSYKALLVRHISGPHSAAANCEDTYTSSLLQLKDLVCNKGTPSPQKDFLQEEPRFHRIAHNIVINDNFSVDICRAKMAYISGYVARKALKRFSCEFCKLHMLQKPGSNLDLHSFVEAKEWDKEKRLLYCNKSFVNIVNKCFLISKGILANSFSLKSNISDRIVLYVKHHVHFTFVCDAHKDDISEFIIRLIARFCIHNFCTGVNRILLGKQYPISNNSCKLYQQAVKIRRNRFKGRHV